MPLVSLLPKLRDRQSLTLDETREAFDAIFTGAVSEDLIAAFLLALRRKGETATEILGATVAMRSKADTICAPAQAIDIVGTGGDAKGTLNISTAAAFVVAACGVPVAKHGNRAATSKSGSSDVLAALGVNLEAPFSILEQCLRDINLCFLFAPRHHPAMRFVAPVRKKLGVRTIFNLLGPLTNPANVKRHLIGVFAADWLVPMAETLHELGSEAAWLTHGGDGLDEISTTATTTVVALQGGEISSFAVSPEEAGLPVSSLEQLLGGDAAVNAEAIRRLFEGERGPYRDIVILNAAAALIVGGKVGTLREGVGLASESLDSGQAHATLRALIELTNRTRE